MTLEHTFQSASLVECPFVLSPCRGCYYWYRTPPLLIISLLHLIVKCNQRQQQLNKNTSVTDCQYYYLSPVKVHKITIMHSTLPQLPLDTIFLWWVIRKGIAPLMSLYLPSTMPLDYTIIVLAGFAFVWGCVSTSSLNDLIPQWTININGNCFCAFHLIIHIITHI